MAVVNPLYGEQSEQPTGGLDTGGRTPMGVMSKAKMRLGGGGRFAKLKGQLAERPGVHNPGALAAYIGRKKYGASKFAHLSAVGRRRQ